MKKLLLILILISTTAQADQAECVVAVKNFNKKFAKTAEIVFLEFKEYGSPLYFRKKSSTPEQEAAGMSAVRTCIKTGFPFRVYLGDMEHNDPTSHCDIRNTDTMAAVCGPIKEGGSKKPKYEIIRLGQ